MKFPATMIKIALALLVLLALIGPLAVVPPAAALDIEGPASEPDNPPDPAAPPPPGGPTALANPALGQSLPPVGDDPLGAFSRRPLEGRFIIPEGGTFLDPLRDDPHYGVDYACPDDYLNGLTTDFYPVGPGYVTARSSCVLCFAEGDSHGSVTERWPRHNFGWGGFVLIETPYNASVSIYIMYAHLARDFVSLGDYITPDEAIGVVGNSGYSQETHLHMEVRYGTPGRFWNADFSQWETLDRWLATMFVNPAWVIFPDNHYAFVAALDEWTGLVPKAPDLP
ncbi:MAG: M23 family metallopeptidase [Anaerolineae bacterium]|nr:M23 family metallopeptidase [Anaerolineae bacterium]